MLLEEVLEWVRKQTAAQTALLLLPTPGGTEVDFALAVGQGAEELRGLRLRPDETVLDDLLQKRTVWRFYNESEPESHSRGVRRGFKGLQSGIGVPLPALPTSALVLVNRRQHEPFDENAIALLQTIAPLFTIAVYLHGLRQALEQHEREREWLRHLPEPLREEFSLQRVLQTIEPVLRAMAPVSGGLWLYNEERTRLLCTLHYGAPLLPAALDPATLPPDWYTTPSQLNTESGLVAKLLPLNLTGRPLGLLALGEHARGESLPRAIQEAAVAGASLPLLHEAKDFSPLLVPIALLIAHAMLHEQLARRSQQMASLYEFSHRIGEVRSLESGFALMANTALQLAPADHAVIYFAPDASTEPERLQPVCVSPPNETLLRYMPGVPYSLPGWVYAFNAPLDAPDLPHHPQNLKEPLPGDFQSALAVPLQRAEQVYGVLMLVSSAPREFTLAEVESLFTLANFGMLRLQTLES